MKRILTASEMKQMDEDTIQKKGMFSMILMERAALETVRLMEAHFQERKTEKTEHILVLCGSGNNGGDGVAIARILFLHGYRAEYSLPENTEHFSKGLMEQIRIAENYQVPRVNIPDLRAYTTIVDAIFGVGLSREIRGACGELIRKLADTSAWKVAVDLPSGIDGSTGQILGQSYHADLTVTYGYQKAGLCLFPGREAAGELHIADVGIYCGRSEKTAYAMEDGDLLDIPQRQADGNKGTFGKLLFVTGAVGMAGASYLSAAAAFSAGIGMVKILTVPENRIPLQTLLPEAMVSTMEDDLEHFLADMRWCDAVVIGPGLGMSEQACRKTEWFLRQAALMKKPLIIDADGLNHLSNHPEWKKYGSENWILTPHVGEMSRLTGKSISRIKEDPVSAARICAKEMGAVLVLKDACTVLASPDEQIYYNLSGNAVLATAGSGDVLAGILGAMLVLFRIHRPEFSFIRCAALGVYLHGKCGDYVRDTKGSRGMKARDIIEALPCVLSAGESRRKE